MIFGAKPSRVGHRWISGQAQHRAHTDPELPEAIRRMPVPFPRGRWLQLCRRQFLEVVAQLKYRPMGSPPAHELCIQV
jgi:hypothetical protein